MRIINFNKLKAKLAGYQPFYLLFLPLLLGSYLCRPIGEPELYFNLTIGRWIQAHHDVPHVYLWSELGKSQAWVSTHWFFQLTISVLEDLIGFENLIFVKFDSFGLAG